MKRLLGILLVLVLCAGLLPAPVYAASGTDQNIKWTVKNDVLTISGKGAIPNYWNFLFGANPPWRGQPYSEVVIKEGITETSDALFYARLVSEAIIRKVTLPNSMTKIAFGTFYGQSKLKECVLPAHLEEVEEDAFRYCNLSSVKLPESVRYVGKMAFFNNARLKSVTLPSGFCALGERAFASCDLRNLHIPESYGDFYVESAFCGNSHLATITLGEGSSMKVVDNVLYSGDGKDLILYAPGRTGSSYTVPDTVTGIGYGAFEDSRLTEINLPATVRTFGLNTFCGCAKLRKITLPQGITQIPELAFYQCKSLTELTVPEGVTSIGHAALDECDNLSAVTLPKSLSFVDEGAFELGGLKDVYYAGTRADRKSIQVEWRNDLLDEARWHYAGSTETETATVSGGKYALNKDRKTAAFLAPVKKSVKTLTIPATIKVGGKKYKVTEIAENACRGLSKLTKVSIGKNVKYIERNAFLNCKKLKTVTGMAGVDYVRDAAFKGCKALTKIVLSLPGAYNGIGVDAFRGCGKLKDIQFKSWLDNYWIGANAFKGVHPKAVVRVPISCADRMRIGLRKRGLPKTATVIEE